MGTDDADFTDMAEGGAEGLAMEGGGELLTGTDFDCETG